MLWFHLRQYARNSYFVQLAFTSTLAVLVTQALGSRVGGANTEQLWLNSALIGMWTLCTISAGMLGFQRFQGTLSHLLFSPRHPARVLMPLLAAVSVWGLLAFPIAALGAVALGLPVHVQSWPVLIVGVLAYWAACLALCSVVAPLFVLTPDALTYEGLLMVPIVLLSGVFGLYTRLGWALPTTHAIALLRQGQWHHLVGCLAVALCWFTAGIALGGWALRRATVLGTLEVNS